MGTAISSVTMLVALSLSCLLVLSSVSAFPQQLPPGVDAASCPNFPFCGPSPTGAGAAPSANTPALQARTKKVLGTTNSDSQQNLRKASVGRMTTSSRVTPVGP